MQEKDEVIVNDLKDLLLGEASRQETQTETKVTVIQLLKIGSWGVVLSCDGIEGVPTRCFFVLFVLTWR